MPNIHLMVAFKNEQLSNEKHPKCLQRSMLLSPPHPPQRGSICSDLSQDSGAAVEQAKALLRMIKF